VAVPTEREPEARGVVAAFGVVADDERVVADPESRHRRREVSRLLKHGRRMARGGWGSGDIAAPVDVDRTG
jgi:hypothetical protein